MSMREEIDALMRQNDKLVEKLADSKKYEQALVALAESRQQCHEFEQSIDDLRSDREYLTNVIHKVHDLLIDDHLREILSSE